MKPSGRNSRFVRALITDAWIRFAALLCFAVSTLTLFVDVTAFQFVAGLSFGLYAAFAFWRARELSK